MKDTTKLIIAEVIIGINGTGTYLYLTFIVG